jgi:hypothetical protein
MRKLMMILLPLLMALGSPPGQPAAPMQVCEVRTGAWCLIRSGIYFDVKTVSNDRRVWRLFGSYLGSSSINIIESRACSAVLADSPVRSENVGRSLIDGSKKYIVKISFNKEASCTIFVELPLIGGDRDQVSYEFVMTAIRAIADMGSAGTTLSSIALKRN